MSRLPPPDFEDWSEATRAIFGDRRGPVTPDRDPAEAEGAPPNILFTIAHHPDLLEPFLQFSATLALRGTLSRRDSELLALRAAWNCQSPFEWGHHVHYARSHGLAEDEIEQLTRDAEEVSLGVRERLLLRAADQLHGQHTIDDETWSALAQHYEPAQLVEIPFVVGHYSMLSMVANATEVPVEPGYPAMPSRSDTTRSGRK